MTIVLAIVLIAGFTSKSSAQISIGAKAGIALPMGTFGDGYKMGFGGAALGEYSLNENMSIGLSIGYYSFSGKDFFDGISLSIIPIVADFKYYFADKGFMPYVGAGLGMYMSSTSDYSKTVYGVTITVPGGSSSDFGFSPKVGFWMGDSFKWGACLDYNIVSNANHLGFNVGILYPLGK
ncbi:MAG: outer membrane beta-barrel protein [Bacteroidetes bacterium]|nr:outer membrane beta-barrel protein [Bacteroidota bacterium]